jgi:hypothetical protein
MKKITTILAFLLLGSFLVAGNAAAIGLDYYTGNAADAAYQDTNQDYAHLTDLTDPASAPMFQISTSIISSYQHDYVVGLFDYDGSTVNTLDVLDTYKGVTSSNVIFDLGAGTADSNIDTSSINAGNFGFFIQFYTDDSSGVLSSVIYYSDSSINGDPDFFSFFYDRNGISAAGYAEMALGIGGPTTQGHALVSVADVAPVPEPATMMLLGFGILGLGVVSRKKFMK